jgi:hypothetical protein
LFLPLIAAAQTTAFPGAEGYGRYTVGGRYGRVIEVTNLNDNGTGSLRAAVTASGARTVVFRVSGTIKLLSKLEIKKDSITIAGQTAPGDGICIRDYTFRVSANQVIIRYMRFRLGDSTKYADDSFDGMGALGSIHRNVIIDHCSVSWSLDEAASFYDNGPLTFQWCYVTESLYHSYHPKGNHGYGGMWGGWHASFHHNLLAHHSSRNPRFNGSRYTSLPDSEVVDFRNNVIYNWGFNSAYGGEAGNQNMVANYYKSGPGTSASVRGRIVEPYDNIGNWYIADNYVEGVDSVTADNWLGVQGGYADSQRTRKHLEPFPIDPNMPTQTPAEAYNDVLLFGGASLHRDSVDSRITNEVITGTAAFGGSYKGPHTGIIDSQDSVGGWPVLNSLPAAADNDHDGIPDEWETAHGLNPADPADGGYFRANGRTNLEAYLNSLVAQFPEGVREVSGPLPAGFVLLKSYPNPFNPVAHIEFTLQQKSHVRLEVFSLLGASVATLVDGDMPAGTWQTEFDASRFSSGVYFGVLHAGSVTKSLKLVLMK